MTPAEQQLISALKNKRRLDRRDVASRLTSVPGTFHTAVREGPTAAHAYAQSFREQGQYVGLDPEEAADLKESLIDKMLELEKDAISAKDAEGERSAKFKEAAWKLAIEAAMDIQRIPKQYSAQVLTSANTALSALTRAYTDDLAAASGEQNDAQAAGMREVGLAERAGVGQESEGDMLVDPAARAANTAELTGNAQARADQLASDVEMRSLEAKAQAEANFKEGLKGIVKGVGGVDADKLIADAERIYAVQTGEGDLETRAAALGEIADENVTEQPGESPTYAHMEQLLSDLDKPMEFIPATGQEAKRQIMASENFQAWKTANGLQDDDMAWKAFRRHFGEQIKQNKRSDRIRMQEIAHGDVVTPEAPAPEAPPAAKPEQAPEQAAPSWAIDPNTGSVFDANTGREASEEEFSALGDITSLPQKDPADLINFKDPAELISFQPPPAGEAMAVPVESLVQADSFKPRTPAQMIVDIQNKKRKPKYTDKSHWGL